MQLEDELQSNNTMDETNYFLGHQQIILSIAPVITGFLSLLGSSFIIFLIYRDREKRLKKTYHRLLLGISISDLLNSARACTSSFVMPRGTPGVWNAKGTQLTCEIQGFFAQLGLATTLYLCGLSTYFLLEISSRQRTARTRKWLELAWHAIPILFAVSTAVAGLTMDLYNPVELGIGCWIAAAPMGCQNSPEVQCERGQNADVILWAFAGVEVILSLLFVVGAMLAIYLRVRQQVNLIEKRYAVVSGQQSLKNREKLRKTMVQSFLYISAFLLTYLFTSMLRIMENDGESSRFFAISLLSQIFHPLEGFFNFFIYTRPSVQDLKKQHPEKNMFQLYHIILRGNAPVNKSSTLSRDTGGPLRLGGAHRISTMRTLSSNSGDQLFQIAESNMSNLNENDDPMEVNSCAGIQSETLSQEQSRLEI